MFKNSLNIKLGPQLKFWNTGKKKNSNSSKSKVKNGK